MFIELHELKLHPIDFEEEFRPGAIDFGPDLRQVESLHSEGRAQLDEEHHGNHLIIKDIRLNDRLTITEEIDCALCLDPVGQEVNSEVELLYRPLTALAGASQTRLH